MYEKLICLTLIAPVLSRGESAWNDVVSVWDDVESALRREVIRGELTSFLESNPESKCWRDMNDYVTNIGNIKEKLWANQMFDSMVKIPYGILYGRQDFIGIFDECLAAEAKEFKGKHCMLKVSFTKGSPPGLTKPGFFYGVCLPSSCMATDIQEVIDGLLSAVNITVTADEKNCWTSDPIQYSTEDWIVICFFLLVIIIALCSTVFDYLHENNIVKSKRYELYSSFSLSKNLKQWVKIYKGPGNIGCLHGIRALTMCWIILCHEYIMPTFGPSMNKSVILPYITNKEKIMVTNGFVSVDTFFLLSGLLVTLVFFRGMSKNGSYDVPISMIHRFLRITPAYAAMILFQSTIILKLGWGPLWNTVVGTDVQICRDNWWPTLIYLQNFIIPTSTCLGQSWYLSADMQMFWLSPILLYPLYLWPKIGIATYFVGLGAAVVTNLAVALAYKLGPNIFLTLVQDQFQIDYIQTYMRLTPYLIGMGLAYIICGVKAKKIRINLSKQWVIVGWLASTGLCLGSMYGISYFLDNGVKGNFIRSSLYLAFHRLGWSLGLAWVIFACVVGSGGPVDRMLSWNGFQILGKISYCMFLVHFTIQKYKIGMMQTNFYIQDFNIVSGYFSSLFLSFAFSIPLYILFEVPFSNIDRYFLQKARIFPYPRGKKEERKNEDLTEVENGQVNKRFPD